MLFIHKAFFKSVVLVGAWVLLCVPGVSLHADSSGGKALKQIGVVEVDALNMRSCPEATCTIIRVLRKGETLGITGEKGGWLEVRHRDATGYVSGAKGYVRRDTAAVPGEEDVAGMEDALEKAETIEKQITQKKEDVSRLESRTAELMAALDEIDKELAGVRKRLEAVRRDAAETEERIRKTEKEISKTRAAVEEKKAYAEERLVALYKLNRLGAMNLLATADSTSDLFRSKAAVEAIVARDEKMISQLVAEEKHLAHLLQRGAEEKARQDDLEEQIMRDQARIAEKSKQRKNLLAHIKAKKSNALMEIEYFEEAARRLDGIIENLKRRPVYSQTGEQKVFSEYQGLLKLPVDGKIMSTYGKYTDPQSGAASFRNGIELQADRGTPVRVVFAGETSFSDWITGFGRVIIVAHGDSFYTVYGHLEELFAGEGDEVEANEVIGTVGNSGSISGPALYFEIRHKGKPLDPNDWIEKG